MRHMVIGCLAVMVAAVAAPPAVAQQPLEVTVTRGGEPAANVQFDAQLLNQGKVSLGVTGERGTLDLVLGMANRSKPFRAQVQIYDCPNDTYVVVLVEEGAAAPDDKECRRRVLGWLWFGRARAMVLDLATGTLQIQNGQSFLGSTTGRVVLAGAAGAVGAAVLAGGGGTEATPPVPGTQPPPPVTQPPPPPPPPPPSTPFDPGGNYPVTVVVFSDPGNHRTFIAMEPSTMLTVAIDGTTVRITCPPGSKWTLLTGTFNPTTGQITAEGRGVAANVSNVLFRFAGTIALTGSIQGQLSGFLTVGAGGELQGQATVYSVDGKKQ